jgi:photosystem II stability/assembly factor-like uncharacterized protein
MKYIRRIYTLVLITIIVLIFGILIGEAKKTVWEEISRTEVKHPFNYAGFYNESVGITVGYGGECHYTTDGGKTWPKAENQSMCRFGLEFLNEKTAWHSGNGALIGASVNGGVTWNAVGNFGAGEPNHCRYISFCNETTGWIASNLVLGTTTDGGKNWTEIPLPAKLTQLSAIAGVSLDIVYLLDTGVAGARLFWTPNQGQTWNIIPLGLKAGFYPVTNTPIAAMRLKADGKGTLVICCKGNQLWDLETLNNGKTWSKERIPSEISVMGLFLAPDGRTLTISGYDATITVLRKKD